MPKAPTHAAAMTAADLRQRREALGLSIRALADTLQISKNTVLAYENDRARIPRIFALAFATLEAQPRQEPEDAELIEPTP